MDMTFLPLSCTLPVILSLSRLKVSYSTTVADYAIFCAHIEALCPVRLQKEASGTVWFYLDRTAGRHRDHRDPGFAAAASPGQSEGQGAGHRLPQQSPS